MSALVMRWGGPLILRALIKWRRSDARLLAVLACVPPTPVLYEVVPLFLLVQTFREGTLLIVLTALAGTIVAYTTWGAEYHTFMNVSGQWMVWLVYLPCTVMVLRRPNEGLTFEWRSVWPRKWLPTLASRALAVRAPASTTVDHAPDRA